MVEVPLKAIEVVLGWIGGRREKHRRFCEERMPPLEAFLGETATYLDLMRTALYNHGEEKLSETAIAKAHKHGQQMMLALAPLLFDAHSARDAIGDDELTKTFDEAEKMGGVCRFFPEVLQPGHPAKIVLDTIDEAQGTVLRCRVCVRKLLT